MVLDFTVKKNLRAMPVQSALEPLQMQCRQGTDLANKTLEKSNHTPLPKAQPVPRSRRVTSGSSMAMTSKAECRQQNQTERLALGGSGCRKELPWKPNPSAFPALVLNLLLLPR